MAQTLALVAVHPQQFAPPGLSVTAQAVTVQRQADHRLQAGRIVRVLGQHGGDVGVVVLDGYQRKIGLTCPLGSKNWTRDRCLYSADAEIRLPGASRQRPPSN